MQMSQESTLSKDGEVAESKHPSMISNRLPDTLDNSILEAAEKSESSPDASDTVILEKSRCKRTAADQTRRGKRSKRSADVKTKKSDPEVSPRQLAHQELSQGITSMEAHLTSVKASNLDLPYASMSEDAPSEASQSRPMMEVEYPEDMSYLDPDRRTASLHPPSRFHKRV